MQQQGIDRSSTSLGSRHFPLLRHTLLLLASTRRERSIDGPRSFADQCRGLCLRRAPQQGHGAVGDAHRRRIPSCGGARAPLLRQDSGRLFYPPRQGGRRFRVLRRPCGWGDRRLGDGLCFLLGRTSAGLPAWHWHGAALRFDAHADPRVWDTRRLPHVQKVVSDVHL
ncbi:hypothetical protein BDA96_09G233200 [Sorghum bicolor]|uniref:Uncharacterized protein n=1 Tax=Sorghum bicolor TaxID=4558 RepID=A0A921QC93_SORBI|nr:hypothetical protein BDA96_09G232900 [Sorghum bicolor]KAG0519079.1 hypothetical protein BDA96_09G233200 [Sorghum bicolor]